MSNMQANFPAFILRDQEFDRFDFRNPSDGDIIPGGTVVEFGGLKGIVSSAVRPGKVGTVLLPLRGFLLECEYVTGGHGDLTAGKTMKLNPATGKVQHYSATVTNYVTVVVLPNTERDYDDTTSGVDDDVDTIVRVALFPYPLDGAMTLRTMDSVDNDPFEDSDDEIPPDA